MKFVRVSMLAVLLSLVDVPVRAAPAATTVAAAEVPASEASIQQLFTLTNARGLLDSVRAQLPAMAKQSVEQALQGRTVTQQQQQIVDSVVAKMTAAYQEQLSWEKLEPMYMRIYQGALSQSEVDGMVAFYRSPAGQAVIRKMPLIMQNLMKEMQGISATLVASARQAVSDSLAEAQAHGQAQEQGQATPSAKPPQPATPPKSN